MSKIITYFISMSRNAPDTAACQW